MNQIKFKANKTARAVSIIILALLLVLTAILGLYDYIIPDRISYFYDQEIPVYLFANVQISESDMPSENADSTFCAQSSEGCYRLFDLIPVKTVNLSAYQDLKVYPGGMPFGVKFFTSGVIVVGFSDITCQKKQVNPAKAAGIRQKDIITHINGRELADATDLTEAVESSAGEPLTFTCLRGKEKLDIVVTPTFCEDEGKYKTGVLVRDSGAGIGTISFILPESNCFAGLGHGICDSETGALVPIERGTVVDVTISGVTKGLSGAPGEIKGFFNSGKTGTLFGNTDCGVYGVLTQKPATAVEEPISIALKNDLLEGTAHILCTLDNNGICRYEVEISDIDRNAEGGKCFTVKVTDPRLLEKTGGIIQGMSGSPIIQNGKLVGAVTHVMINDPTTGYGIFIENMLNASQMPMQRAA